MADENKKDVTKLTKREEQEINAILKERVGYEIDITAARKEYSAAGYEILAELRKRARIEKDLKKDAKSYIGYMEEIKDINKEIAAIELKKLQLKSQGHAADSEVMKYLTRETEELKKQRNIIASQLKDARGFRTTIAGISADITKVNKGFTAVKTNLTKFYDFFDIGTMFKMLKTIKTTSAQMGVIGNRSLDLSKNIKRASVNAIQFGVSLEDVAKIQGAYSDELGTTQFLSQESLENLSAMSKVTGMGADEIGKMAAEMKLVGVSSEKTSSFVNQVMNDASSMGLNASKVLKNVSQNLKLLNKYNFKGGVKSLARMAESTTKLGVKMDFAAGMAEKLFDIEGAVEMSAQLQVLGGEWSKLGDPFKLMYMARNDMEGLTNSILNATKASAKFNAKTGEFDIAALDMQTLRKVAEATGLNFEDLAQSAKNAAKYASIRKQIKYGFDDKTKEFIESTSFLDEKGRAKIMVGIDEKYVDSLTEADKQQIRDAQAQQASMKDRAKFTQTFDEQLKNLITMLKTMALPIIEAINNVLAPKLKGLMEKLGDKKWVQKIEVFADALANKLPYYVDKLADFGKSVLHFVKEIGKFVAKFPKLSTALGIGLALAIGGIKWWWYGVQLGKGFNSTARVSGGGVGGSQFAGGSYSKGKRMVGMRGMGMSAGAGALTGVFNAMDAESTGEGVGNIVGGIAGGILGSFLDPFIGPMGTMLGAQLGASLGGKIGAKPKQIPTMNDGIIFNPKDKFTKINDGVIAGTNVNGNKELARTLSSMAPGFSGKNALMNKGANANVSGGAPGTINHKINDMNINQTITVKADAGMSAEFREAFLKDPVFQRYIAKTVHSQTNKELNGGKN